MRRHHSRAEPPMQPGQVRPPHSHIYPIRPRRRAGFCITGPKMDERDSAVRLGVLEHRANDADRAMVAIQRALAEISASLSALVRLEEQHSETRRSLERAFEMIRTQSMRIEQLEGDMPTLRLLQKWAIGGVGSLLAVVGTAFVALVVK